jgi:hypothetical protein
MIGRVHLPRGEFDTATEALDEVMARATSAGWTAFSLAGIAAGRDRPAAR